jgi:redox-regulated HSP33 family molecular chaperone
MQKPKRTFLQIVIDPEKKQKFVSKVEAKGKNITDVLMEFVDNYVDDSEKIDNTEIIRRLEAVEQFVGMEKSRLVGELSA